MLTWLTLEAFGLSLCLIADKANEPVWSGAGKMIASTGMVGLALGFGLGHTVIGNIVLIALALSWLGDLALIWRGPRALIFGIVFFGLAHVAYAAASVYLGVRLVPLLVMAMLLAPALWVVRRTTQRFNPKLTSIVLAYGVMVGTMAALAVSATRVEAPPAWGIGAVAFACSDLFVARRRFGSDSPWNRRIGLPLYYTAQLLMSVAAASAAR